MKNPIFQKTVSAKQVSISQRSLRNHNKLLWRFEGADGIKTGYTKAAGRILVSSAVRDGRRLVAVTIDAPDDWNDHIHLLEKGFSKYKPFKLIKEGSVIAYTELISGVEEKVELIADADFVYSLAEKESVTFRICGVGFSYAPVERGQKAGCVYIFVDGNAVGKVELRYGNSVELKIEEKVSIWQRLFGRTAK